VFATYRLKQQDSVTDLVAHVPKSVRRIKNITVTVSAAAGGAGETVLIRRQPADGGAMVSLCTALDIAAITPLVPTKAVIAADSHCNAGDALVAVVSDPLGNPADDILVTIEW
jgi:hypothetical protein